MSLRIREQAAMCSLLKEAAAAEPFLDVTRRFANEVTESEADYQRVQSLTAAALVEALIHTAKQEGWSIPFTERTS